MAETGRKMQEDSRQSDDAISFRWYRWRFMGNSLRLKQLGMKKPQTGFWAISGFKEARILWLFKLPNQGKWSSIYKKWNEKLTHAKQIWIRVNYGWIFGKWCSCEMRHGMCEMMLKPGCFVLGCMRFSIKNNLHMYKWSQNKKWPIIANYRLRPKQISTIDVWS